MNNNKEKNMKITSVGIIGLGSFGKLIASLVSANRQVKILGFDIRKQTAEHVIMAKLLTVAAADIVILAIPLSAYPNVLEKLRLLLPARTLLVDVCSVKIYPEQYIQNYLPDHPNILLTHPLFGPQTAPPTQGHELIVTKCIGETAHQIVNFCEHELDLKITRVTSKEHDRVMAQIHALTFFVSEGLARMRLPENIPFTTPSYQMLTNLVHFQKTHSKDLFQTVQRGNPFSQTVRRQFIEQLEECSRTLEKPIL
jgi:prephenate dehydrogenase